jgi:hypothetical protein
VSEVFLFADDTKLLKIGTPPGTDEMDILQQDLNTLQDWSNNWVLKFHPAKCKRLFISRHLPDSRSDPLTLPLPDGQHIPLETTNEEKDLGIYIDNSLKFDSHIDKTVKKANRNMGIIRRTFQYLNESTFIPLYKAQVRSTLEYGQSVWSPYLIGDIKKIENVQRYATRQVNGLRGLSYPERLKHLNLPSLRFRRLRGDMIEVFKIIQGYYDSSVSLNLKSAPRASRGHTMKLFLERSRLDIRRKCFRHRIVETWNSLPESVISAPSVNYFKNRLDSLWTNHPMRFDPQLNM